jgi:hypothetical protein
VRPACIYYFLIPLTSTRSYLEIHTDIDERYTYIAERARNAVIRKRLFGIFFSNVLAAAGRWLSFVKYADRGDDA